MFKEIIFYFYIKYYKYHIKEYEHDVNTDCDFYGCKECDGGLCKGSRYFGDILPW